MATPKSDEFKRLLDLLQDGEKHNLEEVMAKVAATVPPGKALRKYQEKADNWAKHNGPRKGPDLTDEQKIVSGQRTMARIAVRSMRQRWAIVEDDKIWLRPQIAEAMREDGELGVDRFDEAEDKKAAEEAEQKAEEPAEPAAEPLPEPDAPAVPVRPEEPVQPEPEPTPVCDSCGLYVANREQHEEFHATHPEAVPRQPELACAFFSEEQIRTIVRTELDSVLGRFQQGMQKWMIHRFSSLESLLPHAGSRGSGDLARSPGRQRW